MIADNPRSSQQKLSKDLKTDILKFRRITLTTNNRKIVKNRNYDDNLSENRNQFFIGEFQPY